MKTVLFATDFSENSINALHFSSYLVDSLGARCTALHVFDFLALASTVSLTYVQKELLARAKEDKNLRQFCDRHLGNTATRDRWSYEVVEGRQAWEQIQKRAKEIKADCIVVGATGNSFVRTLLMGSTTSALIDHADCAVVAVPNVPLRAEVRHIVYASALEESDIQAIEQIVPLARKWKASLRVVHIVTSGEYKGEDQMEWFKEMVLNKVHYDKLGFDLRHSNNLLASLQDYLEDSEADLLVMMEREGSNAWEDLWHSDLVKRMRAETKIPLLSYRKEHLRSVSDTKTATANKLRSHDTQ